jgi:hypothetical protein
LSEIGYHSGAYAAMVLLILFCVGTPIPSGIKLYMLQALRGRQCQAAACPADLRGYFQPNSLLLSPFILEVLNHKARKPHDSLKAPSLVLHPSVVASSEIIPCQLQGGLLIADSSCMQVPVAFFQASCCLTTLCPLMTLYPPCFCV